jgi:hypothetical protein
MLALQVNNVVVLALVSQSAIAFASSGFFVPNGPFRKAR